MEALLCIHNHPLDCASEVPRDRMRGNGKVVPKEVQIGY